jgi:hypothetical protein
VCIRTECTLTSTHLLAQSGHPQQNDILQEGYDPYILEAFILPDGAQQQDTHPETVLTRSHIVSHPFYIRKMFFLSSHTTNAHSLVSRDRDSPPRNTISVTVLARVKLLYDNIGFLDIVLESPGVDEGSMTVSFVPRRQVAIFNVYFMGAAQRGCTRFVADDDPEFEMLLAFAVNSDNLKGDGVIRATDLQDIGYRLMAGDGLTGRLCMLSFHQTSVKICDYV